MTNPQEDTLINAILDGEPAADAWNTLDGLAAGDPALWRRVAQAQHDHAVLVRAVADSVLCADRIELPVEGETRQVQPLLQLPDRFPIARRLTGWAGWAAAAALALAWVIGSNSMLHSSPTKSPSPGPLVAQGQDISHLSTGDVLKAYLDKGQKDGQVVGQLPEKVLLDARPSESGNGYDLLYLRQILERTHVPDLYEFNGQDEQGRPTLVRSERPPGQSM